MNKLSVNLTMLLVLIFQYQVTGLLLLICNCKTLVKQNENFYDNIIYIKVEYIVYYYSSFGGNIDTF